MQWQAGGGGRTSALKPASAKTAQPLHQSRPPHDYAQLYESGNRSRLQRRAQAASAGALFCSQLLVYAWPRQTGWLVKLRLNQLARRCTQSIRIVGRARPGVDQWQEVASDGGLSCKRMSLQFAVQTKGFHTRPMLNKGAGAVRTAHPGLLGPCWALKAAEVHFEPNTVLLSNAQTCTRPSVTTMGLMTPWGRAHTRCVGRMCVCPRAPGGSRLEAV